MAPGISAERRLPVCNSQVEDFIRDKRLRAHKGHLHEARTKINNVWSLREEDKLVSSRQNAKKAQLEADRVGAIKRENMRLLLRMQEIEEKPTAVSKLPRSASVPTVARGSNNGARMQELRRIDSENQRMLKRLHAAKPSVDRAKMEVEHSANRKVMLMRCALSSVGPPQLPARSLQPRRTASRRFMDAAMEMLPAETPQSATSSAASARTPLSAAEEQGEECEDLPAEEEEERVAVDLGFEAKFAGEVDIFGSLGLAMPNASKQRLERLLEDDATDRRAAEAADAARAEAEQAFRNATAVDADCNVSGVNDMLSYDRLVQWYGEVEARREPALALEARAAAAAGLFA